jgi:hypothetical protein
MRSLRPVTRPRYTRARVRSAALRGGSLRFMMLSFCLRRNCRGETKDAQHSPDRRVPLLVMNPRISSPSANRRVRLAQRAVDRGT